MMRCRKCRVVMDARAGLFKCPRCGYVEIAKTKAGTSFEKVWGFQRPEMGAAVMV